MECVTIFQLKPWIGLSLDSHQLTVEETGLFQQSKNIKAYIRLLQSAVIAFHLKWTGVEFF